MSNFLSPLIPREQTPIGIFSHWINNLKNIWVSSISVSIYLLLTTDCKYKHLRNIYSIITIYCVFFFYLRIKINNKIDFFIIHATSIKNRLPWKCNFNKQRLQTIWKFFMKINRFFGEYYLLMLLFKKTKEIIFWSLKIHKKFVLKLRWNEKKKQKKMKNIKTNVKYWYSWILKYFFFYKIFFWTKKNIICAPVSPSMLSNVRIVRIALWMLETLEPSRQETIEARKYNNKCTLECNRILCCLQVQPVAELSELSRRGGSDGRQVELAAANIRGGTLRRSGSLRFHQNMVSIFVSYFNPMMGSFFKKI